MVVHHSSTQIGDASVGHISPNVPMRCSHKGFKFKR
jgi:hypothetical protein